MVPFFKAIPRWVVAWLTAVSAWSLGGDALAAEIEYKHDIEPLLTERCGRCHGRDRQKGGLRLDLKSSVLRGGDSGEPGIVPGQPAQSRLFQLVSSADDDERIPPASAREARLSASELDRLRRWIESGAEWPESTVENGADDRFEMRVTSDDRQHWAFKPLASSAVPQLTDAAWPQTPVDAFIRRAQEEANVIPSPPATARILVRRIFLDLIGLPPSPDEMARWVQRIDQSQEAVAALIESLLQSPHYGERWARHWLDVARYADSNGMELDADRPNAYRFRDFVIRAVNNDLPFDTFVQWQLAGDEIAPGEPDAIAATGFIAAGVNTILPDKQMVEEKLRNRANELDDMVSTTGQALLGLTLACARCHDHKYDPLPTRDYYRLTRIFNGGDRAEVPIVSPDAVAKHEKALAAWQKDYDRATNEREAWLQDGRQQVATQIRDERVRRLDITDDEKRLLRESPDAPRAKKLADRFKEQLRINDEDIVSALSPEAQAKWKAIEGRIEAISARKPKELPKAFAFADFGPEPTETWFFERGDFMARNERMDFGFLTVLTSEKPAETYWRAVRSDRRRHDSTQQRRALAEWITDVDSGAGALLARVMVNRVWQHHFGRGIVGTPSDFGTRGDRPSHPTLLEWLADDFVRNGWSIKRLHRLMLNSATYQQASDFSSERAARDPQNRLWWRQRPVRLEAEVLRDSMLAVAGTLNRGLYGPAVKPPIPLEALQARNVRNPYPKNVRDTPETRRRSIYMFHKRVVQYPLMQAFDAPDAQQSCGARMNTTVAPQALAILNDPFVRLRAAEFAARLRSEAGDDVQAQVIVAFQLGLNRSPDPEELSQATNFIERQTRERVGRGDEQGRQVALTDFCHSLFGLNEFIYVD